jgi:hypothetical protein
VVIVQSIISLKDDISSAANEKKATVHLTMILPQHVQYNIYIYIYIYIYTHTHSYMYIHMQLGAFRISKYERHLCGMHLSSPFLILY